MNLVDIIGTIVVVAVVALSLLAVMDVLFATPHKKKAGEKDAEAGQPGARHIWSRK